MSNQYGFDFLKSQHVEEQDDDGRVDDGSGARLATTGDLNPDDDAELLMPPPQHIRAQNKPDLEKQYDILAFLQAHRGSGCLAASVIYKATGINLEVDETVADMLQRNAKVRIEQVPDPENPALMVPTYAYQAKYSNVRDATSLLAQINRMTNGIPTRDLTDSYPQVERDIQELIKAGEIIAVANTEDKDKILFPRGDHFIVELDGIVSLPHSALTTSSDDKPRPVFYVETDVESRTQIRRGEAIQVGGQWFRVSSAVKEGPLSEQPARAQAPLSVVSLHDMSKRNDVDGYIRNFSAKEIPLDDALSTAAQDNVRKAKSARDRLLRAIHGSAGGSGSGTTTGGGAGSGGGHRLLSSGVTQQLLGNLAHVSNPTTLVTATSSSSAAAASSSSRNKRKLHHHGTASDTASDQSSLAAAASDPAWYLYRHARRHGTTKDVRQMYLETRDVVPEADADLKELLVQHKLMDRQESLRRPRLTNVKSSNFDNDGKPKKRRYYERKNQRMTNTHLEGTEIGALLALATERQNQGQNVGDGGM